MGGMGIDYYWGYVHVLESFIFWKGGERPTTMFHLKAQKGQGNLSSLVGDFSPSIYTTNMP